MPFIFVSVSLSPAVCFYFNKLVLFFLKKICSALLLYENGAETAKHTELCQIEFSSSV